MHRRVLLPLVALTLVLALTAGAQTPKKNDKEKTKAASMTTYTMSGGDGAFLGIFTDDVSSENAASHKLKEERGVIVADVVEGSPAEKAGLKKDDVILEFSGEKVQGKNQLNRMINETPPGRTVDLLISRDGGSQHVKATLADRTERDWFNLGASGSGVEALREKTRALAERNREIQEKNRELADRMRERAEEMRNRAGASGYSYSYSVSRRRIGVQTMQISKQLADYFGVSSGRGLLITSVEKESAAEKAGLKAGDVIVDVDGHSIEDSSELVDAINRKDDGTINIKITRNRSEMQITVNPDSPKREDDELVSGIRSLRIFPRGFIQAEPHVWLDSDFDFPGLKLEIPSFALPRIPPAPPIPAIPAVPGFKRYQLMRSPARIELLPSRPLDVLKRATIRNSRVM